MATDSPTDPRTAAEEALLKWEVEILRIPPAERAISCGGMKRNWERERSKLESLGFSYPAVSWGDGTFSYEYAPGGSRYA
jgi:hypothetical protein